MKKIILLFFCLSLSFVSSAYSIDVLCLMQRYYSANGSSIPCQSDLLTWWDQTEFTDDYVSLKDQSTTSTHQAEPAGSVEFRGGQYASVSLTGYTYLNAEVWEFGFSFYNTVAINKSTAAQQVAQLTSSNNEGVAFGAITGLLTDEIITVMMPSGARSGYAHTSEEISTGKHDVKIVWSGTAYTIELDGVQVNNVSAGTQAVLSLSLLLIGVNGSLSDYLDDINLYDIYAKNQAGTTIFQNAMAYGAANIISTVGPDGTLVNGLTSDRVESSLFGHDGFNTLGWSDGASIPEAVTGKVPASITTPSQDIYGNTLTYSGKASENLKVSGYTIGWDGTAYGTLGSAITLSGNFDIEQDLEVSSLAGDNYLFSGSGIYSRVNATTGVIRVQVGAGIHVFSPVVVVDTHYIVRHIRRGTDMTVSLVDDNGTVQTDTKTVDDASVTITLLYSYLSGVSPLTGTSLYMKLYNSAGTLINHWPIEGRNVADDTQITIYDVVGDNDATVVSGTLPLFTEVMTPSYLARYGAYVTNRNVIPYGASTNSNTFNGVFDAPDDIFAVELVEATLAMQEADPTEVFITKSTGAVKSLDPYDLATIADYAFIGNGSYTHYNDDISGSCLVKTNKYHDITTTTTYWLDENGDQILDINGDPIEVI